MTKIALALTITLCLFACKSRPASTNDNAPIQLKGPAPDFELENVAGGKIKAADLKGKISVVDFWATWCEPCWSEVPKFNKMAEELRGKDVQILAITVQSPYADIKPKVKELGMKYTVLVGNDDVEERFGGMIGYPTTFIISKDWKIYKKYMGALADKDARIKKDIEKLLSEQGNNAD